MQTVIQHCQQVADVCKKLYGENSLEYYVALYHDYLEDNIASENVIKSLLEKDLYISRVVFNNVFIGKILTALRFITRQEKETYVQYIDRVKLNDVAKRVKVADLIVNLHLREQPPRDSLQERYHAALNTLL